MTIAEKLTAIAENQQKVYDAGVQAGKAAGGDTDAAYQQGVDDGKQAERKAFWNSIQENGNRTDYTYAFQGYTFRDDMFYPMYDMKPVGNASNMFAAWSNDHAKPYKFDLAARLEECGVELDTSGVTDASRMFYYGYAFTRLPTIDLRNATSTNNVFAFCSTHLTTIDKVIVSETTPITNWFNNDTGLVSITFEGCIGQSINFSWSPLSVDSMKNIIDHLKDFSNADDKNTMTLKFSDACWTALEDDGAAPDGNTWKDYVFYTLCWNT